MSAITNSLGGLIKFLKKVKMELKKVNWPSKKELTSYTIVVLVTVTVLVTFIGVVDVIFTQMITSFIM